MVVTVTGAKRIALISDCEGNVAALEAALALRELAGERISTTILCPEAEFVYRPMRVREPFAWP